jgi:hypothetical protein
MTPVMVIGLLGFSIRSHAESAGVIGKAAGSIGARTD